MTDRLRDAVGRQSIPSKSPTCPAGCGGHGIGNCRESRAVVRAEASMRLWGLVASAAVGCVLTAGAVSAQGRPASTTPAAEAQAASAPSDPLGRETPRGTVLGFLAAARRGDYAVAHQYLDTRLGANAAQRLARQLFVVLDARLPARLTLISDEPAVCMASSLRSLGISGLLMMLSPALSRIRFNN